MKPYLAIFLSCLCLFPAGAADSAFVVLRREAQRKIDHHRRVRLLLEIAEPWRWGKGDLAGEVA